MNLFRTKTVILCFCLSVSSTISAEILSLKSETVTSNGIGFAYSGASFDTIFTNPPHWQISSVNSSMTFYFSGPGEFTFNAREGVSHISERGLVDVYVNGVKYWEDLSIERDYAPYTIPISQSGEGFNDILIVHTEGKPFWIDEVELIRPFTVLRSEETLSDTVEAGEWKYYSAHVFGDSFEVTLTNISGDVQLYAKTGGQLSSSDYDCWSSNAGSTD